MKIVDQRRLRRYARRFCETWPPDFWMLRAGEMSAALTPTNQDSKTLLSREGLEVLMEEILRRDA